MAEDLVYLDSSALVKLLVREAESEALREALRPWPIRVSSDLARVEVLRVARRISMERVVHRRAREILASLHLLRMDPQLLDRAAELEPAALRSLDAIHLASALSLKADLAAFVVYDRALAGAAGSLGIPVLSPS